MTVTRRSFIRAAGALPVAAAAATIAPAALPEGAELVVEQVEAPAPAWGWYAGHDGERFGLGPYDTKEEMLQAAYRELGDRFHILEAAPGEYDLDAFRDGRGVELLDEHNQDLTDPDGDYIAFDVNAEQRAELDAMLNAAVRAWVNKHDLPLTSWRFDCSRNDEYFGPPETEGA